MSIKYLLCLISITTLLNFDLCLAQTPTASIAAASPAPSITPERIVNDDFVEWQLQMAENSYAFNKNLKNKIQLLNSYEKVLAFRCMPQLHTTLNYDAKTKDNICLEYINKTLALDSGNLTSICARDGIDSSSCRSSSKVATFGVYYPNNEEREGTASLDDVLLNKREEPILREKTQKLLQENSNFMLQLRSAKKSELQAKIRDNHQQILSLNCKRSRIRLKEIEGQNRASPIPTFKSAFSNSDPLQPNKIIGKPIKVLTPKGEKYDPFASLLELKNEDNSKTDIAEASDRIYEITEICDRAIENALKFDATIALAICYKHGFYTPQCIDAKRKEKNLQSSTTKATPSLPPKPMATF